MTERDVDAMLAHDSAAESGSVSPPLSVNATYPTPTPSRSAPATAAGTALLYDRADTLRTGRNYLRRGDPCRVSGERGVFRFVEIVTNTATGSVWAEVVGPASNPRTRSFRTERVRRVRRDTPTR